MDRRPIVIVGTGLGGYSLAREFRKLDAETPVLILTADDGRYYSKPILSNAYTSGKTPDTIALADAAAMASQLKATVRTGTRVTAIEPDRETLWIDGKGMTVRGLTGNPSPTGAWFWRWGPIRSTSRSRARRPIGSCPSTIWVTTPRSGRP